MGRACFILFVLFATLLLGATLPGRPTEAGEGARTERPLFYVVRLDDQTISAGTVRYVERVLRDAEAQKADGLILFLDTPGGVLTSTRQVVKRFLASPVPVVVYVAPSGSRAASAGLFITLSAHVAAMAPGTTIGAAHPVQIGTLPIGPRPGDQDKSNSRDSDTAATMEGKIVNDTVAWARALAQYRKRNEEWSARAVSESASLPATEALEQGVIDLVASDFNDLLRQLDGREVQLPDGPATLQTADARTETVGMWWGEQVLAVLGNPNVAFLLLIFGFYGILFELYAPGWGVAGTLGVVCLLLGLFGLAVLPVNYLGLALLVVALGLFTAEMFVTSHGALALGGLVCLLLGGLMLIESPAGFTRVSWNVVLPVAGATALIVLALVSSVMRTHRRAVQTGGEGLIGEEVRAAEAFEPQDDGFAGAVRLHGERWRAFSQEPVQAGQTCRVRRREGLTLFVEQNKTPQISQSA